MVFPTSSDNDQNASDILRRAQELFFEAEEQIKKTERGSLKLHIPAINELRYAGHHLLKGLASTQHEVREEQFRRTLRHCQRSRYDAVEILLWDYLEEFKAFQDDYRTISIPRVWPEYVADSQGFENARSVLESVVKSDDIDDQIDNRVRILEETLRICDLLAPIVSKAKIARTELNKLLEEKLETEKRERRNFQLALWGILVGILVSLLTR